MAIPTAAQLVANWKRGMQSAGAKYTAGVNAVTESPMDKAASPQSRQKYAQSTQQAAVDGGRMETGLRRTTLDSWKRAAAGVGAANLVTGAQKGEPKLAAKAQQLVDAQRAAKDAAANATGIAGKVLASVNAMRAAFGKPPMS